MSNLPSWYTKARKVPGMSGRMWAVLDHMADLPEHERRTRTGALIRQGAKFSITVDGYAMVDFSARGGETHSGAFWGEWAETVANVYGLIDHLNASGRRIGWNSEDAAAMSRALSDTVGIDYRQG